MQAITEKRGRKIQNLEEFLIGTFQEEMKELFQGEDDLFPVPRENSFNCNCPNWASMCKHVAAVLYGVGAKLDEEPLPFFMLGGIEAGHFVNVTLANRVEAMLANADKLSSRIIEDEDINALFGVL